MGMESEENIRDRELVFAGPHPDPRQPASALLALGEIPAVYSLRVVDESRLHIRYDVRGVSFAEIEEFLTHLGFHLDNGLLTRMKRAFFQYTDDTIRANNGIRPGGTITNLREVFLHGFGLHRHGCRDDRPRHWRQYL